jgi:hypothetical protein
MKTILFLLLVMVNSVIATAQNGFALIELFTSQGCSSCPAADKNLTDLLVDQGETEIYALSFHVDYWNYIGWKDPYSSKAFTERQRNYAKSLPSNVYTPQMVVNGKAEFVGSSKDKAITAIKTAVQETPKYKFDISNLVVNGDKVIFNYKIDKAPEGELLNVALVERGIENYVSRGENNGKTLHHDNVVKSFETVPLKKSGKLELTLHGEKLENCSVILYAQNKDLRVVAAGSKPVK